MGPLTEAITVVRPDLKLAEPSARGRREREAVMAIFVGVAGWWWWGLGRRRGEVWEWIRFWLVLVEPLLPALVVRVSDDVSSNCIFLSTF